MRRARSAAGSSGETQQAKLVYSERPQPWMSGIRARASKSRANSTGRGADDTIRYRRVGTFSRVTPAASSMGKSEGTTLETSTDSARITWAQLNGSKRSVKTRCPQFARAVIRPKPKACAW